MCSFENPDMVKYVFLTQEQYDSIKDNNNNVTEEGEEKNE
jgi:hypothetical protein